MAEQDLYKTLKDLLRPDEGPVRILSICVSMDGFVSLHAVDVNFDGHVDVDVLVHVLADVTLDELFYVLVDANVDANVDATVDVHEDVHVHVDASPCSRNLEPRGSSSVH